MSVTHGLSDLSIGLRLRYEFSRQFAPYIGMEWSNTYAIRLTTSKLPEEASVIHKLSPV